MQAGCEGCGLLVGLEVGIRVRSADRVGLLSADRAHKSILAAYSLQTLYKEMCVCL